MSRFFGRNDTLIPDAHVEALQKQTGIYMEAFKSSASTQYRESLRKMRSNAEARKSAAMATLINDEKMQAEIADGANVSKVFLRQVVNAVRKGHVGLQKAGVTTSTGFNFYDLRGPANLLYPVNVPFRNMLARKGKVNGGYGTIANWKFSKTPGVPYAGVPEGQRASVGMPDENDGFAKYKEIGVERNVTYTAEFAGEGYTDELADEHLRGLHSLWLQEESLDLFGNSGNGTGSQGFAFGPAPTPTLSLTAGTGFTTGSTVSVAVVLLTALGFPSNGQYGYLGGAIPSVASGLTPTFNYSAPGTNQTINISGGTSQISPISAAITTTSGNNQVTATIPAASVPNGVFGYAWYVCTAGTPALATAYLAAITTNPTATFTAAASALNQNGAATGLNTDYSYEPYDYDGLLTYAAKYGIWQDLRGASLTSSSAQVVDQVENILETLFINYQVNVDAIWGSPDAVRNLGKAILYNGGAAAMQLNLIQTANGFTGSAIPSFYQSRYAVNNPHGAGAIPIKIHPMMPVGTLFFDISTNPYPHSRIPFVREMYVQRDYYSIEWPPVSRAWAFGTYAHQVLAHYMPWVTAVLTGIGPFPH